MTVDNFQVNSSLMVLSDETNMQLLPKGCTNLLFKLFSLTNKIGELQNILSVFPNAIKQTAGD